jgi:hypothetical protein
MATPISEATINVRTYFSEDNGSLNTKKNKTAEEKEILHLLFCKILFLAFRDN